MEILKILIPTSTFIQHFFQVRKYTCLYSPAHVQVGKMGDSEGFNKYKNGDENAKKLYHHAAFQVDSDKNAPSHDEPDTPVTVDDTITANAAFQVDSDENAAHDDTPVTVDDTITALEVENDKIKAQLPTTPLPDDTITAADWQQKDKTVANMNLPWKFDRANLGKEFYGKYRISCPSCSTVLMYNQNLREKASSL